MHQICSAHSERPRHVLRWKPPSIDSMRRTIAAMPKLQEHLIGPILDHRFLWPDLGGPLANGKVFPSL